MRGQGVRVEIEIAGLALVCTAGRAQPAASAGAVCRNGPKGCSHLREWRPDCRAEVTHAWPSRRWSCREVG